MSIISSVFLQTLNLDYAQGEVVATSPVRSRVSEALSVEVSAERIEATLKEGFHFNLQAPNQVKGWASGPIRPQKATNQLLEINLPKGEAVPPGATVVLYVCDDANTFCDIERRLIGRAVGNELKLAGATGVTGTQVEEVTERPDLHGFYHRDFDRVLKMAATDKKILLIEFAARWCPGCQRITSEVLTKKAFTKVARDLVKFYADMDLFETFDLAKKYSITGVPTLLFVDSDGREITRLVDYRRESIVVKMVNEVKANPIDLNQFKQAVLSSKKKPKPNEMLLLGRRLLSAGRSSEAIEVLERLTPVPIELFYAKVERVSRKLKEKKEDAGLRAEMSAVLEEALKHEKDTLTSILWRGELCGLLGNSSEARLKLIKEARELVAKLLVDPQARRNALTPGTVGEYEGLEKFLIAVTWAEFLDELGVHADEAKVAWGRAAEIGQASGITDRQAGPGLRYLIVLVAAEKLNEADRWVLQLIRREPENTDLFRRRARILNGLKRYDEALLVGEQSRKVSEGRIVFLVVEQLAKSYIGLGRIDSAKRILDESLARPELGLEKMKEQFDKLTSLRKTLDVKNAN